ncbi:MAG: DUF3124 domain-containing protein, partial [Melioribacteraceae bacterium]|nr:DUF3124 domain-containing protein [Melioribacteraceae bacterium]
MKNTLMILGILILFVVSSCGEISQNKNTQGQNILEIHNTNDKIMESFFCDTVYVPIYSEIYSETKDTKFRLTATLSIRNTSMHDSIYISTIDYYNTTGKLVRKYLNSNISLKPLETIDYVIEEKDNTGGTGANFVIIWSAEATDLKPIFQGVMIS